MPRIHSDLMCRECGKPVYRTGESHPTSTPIWFYSCWNWHIFKTREVLADVNHLMGSVMINYGSELSWKSLD